MIVVECTCGRWRLPAGATSAPDRCPSCGAPARDRSAGTDYVRAPWEELAPRGRKFGVFYAEGDVADPAAIFDTEDDAVEWLAWQRSRGVEGSLGNGDYTVMAIDRLEGHAWNSHEPPPALVGESPVVAAPLLVPVRSPGSPMSAAEFRALSPLARGYAVYMVGSRDDQPNVPDEKNPYRPGTQEHRDWSDGAARAAASAQDGDD